MAVYRDYDQKGLDAQYNLRARVAEHGDYFRRWAENSARVRATRSCRLDLVYDGTPTREKLALDFFPAVQHPAPCLAFIHGGYWQAFAKSDFSFLAPAFQDAGVSVAVVNYTLAPEARMDEIVRQNRAAIAWLYRNAEALGIDAGRLHVSGHSAGGHLTATMMTADWRAFGLERPPLGGACAISGLYDLEPIRLCYLNQVLGMDVAEARRNSPIHAAPKGSTPLILSVGGAETPEYHRQQAEFAAAWRKSGVAIEIVEQPRDDHFSVIERLGEADSPLHRAVLRQISGSSS